MRKIVLLLSLCGYAALSWSQTSAEVLQSKLNALSTMTAHFSQTVKAKKSTVAQSSGTMALQRPGRFRWSTSSPMEQLIVADGQKMWIYDVELEQVTVKKQQKGLGGTAALFLSGYDNQLANDFDVVERSKGQELIFDLKAKAPKENFQRITLTFDEDKLTRLELYDQLGQITYVTLSQIKNNKKLAQQLFQFKPPKGIDVVRQ